MAQKYKPIKLPGREPCDGCSRPFALKTIGKWKVLARGLAEEQDFEYTSCEDCDNDVRQKTYDKAYQVLKARVIREEV